MAVAVVDTGISDARPAIPVEDLGRERFAGLVRRHPERLRAILDSARRSYTGLVLRCGDAFARSWSAALPPLYRDELTEVAAAVGEPGAWLLNFSYEWGCTSACAPEPDGSPRLLRSLDWGLAGLGRTIIAARVEGPAGPWINLTWPGFVGAVQGLAPGRFAAAINQAPTPGTGCGRIPDWAAGKLHVWRQRGTSPVLALRAAFDTCRSFADAKSLLTETPLCAPALITLVGVKPGEAALIERTPNGAVVHEGPTPIANHWLTPTLPGRSRSVRTLERLAQMRGYLETRDSGAAPFDWLSFPILNETTRLAMEAVPATGRLVAQAYESDGPVSAVLDLAA